MLRFQSSRALSAATVSSAAVSVSALSALQQAQRGYVTAKGRCEYRLDYTHSTKRGAEALRDLKEGEEKKAVKNPQSKKEQMAHLLERPKYEYVPDFQRWADDMMAVQSDPRKFCDDMSYHFVRVGKNFNGSQTWVSEASSCGQFNKLKAPN